MPISALPFTTLAPMLARSSPSVPGPDSAGGPYSYEPKWDGFRAVVLSHDGEVEILSRSGKSMTRYFPDVVAAVLAELPPRIVVDGEIVAVRGTRLDFELLGQRIHPAASRVRMLAEHAPAALVVFDVLAVGEESLLERPLAERIGLLDGLGLTGPGVHRTPRTADPDVARGWLATFEGAGLDGVMAKPLAGTYEPGKRAMVKIKHSRTADVVLAGYREHKDSTPERPLLGSLLLGLYSDTNDDDTNDDDTNDDDTNDDGAASAPARLQFVGVSASFPLARRAELMVELAPLVVDTADADALALHPWGDWADPSAHAAARKPGAQSRWSGGKDLSFTPLRPERVLEVGYDHMEGTRFRHTTQLKRWRPDREPTSCTFDQLEEIVGYEIAELLPGAPSALADFTGQPPT